MISNVNLDEISRADHTLMLAKYAFFQYYSGDISECFKTLKMLQKIYPVSTAKIESFLWFKVVGIVYFDDSLNRGDLKEAQKCLEEWQPCVIKDTSLAMIISIKRALLLNRVGRVQEVLIVNYFLRPVTFLMNL